jgi:hypothetical protein
MVKNSAGKEVEDESRTNVCMPGPSIAHRKNVARMTVNPPKIDYISRKNPEASEKLSAWRYLQYDTTCEGEMRRKLIGQAEAFGLAVAKSFQDDITIKQAFRVRTAKATRSQLMQAQGTTDEEIQASKSQAVGQLGPEAGMAWEQLSPEEVSAAVAQFGPEIENEQLTKKYDGPSAKSIFIDDIKLPPACESVDSADWVVEKFIETPAWLEYWKDKKYKDPKTGEQIPVMDEKCIAELIEKDDNLPEADKATLRERFRAQVGLEERPLNDRTIRSIKKYEIWEVHERRDDGKIWIYWVANQKQFLGEMPYPWDLRGQFVYTELVFLPDFISVFGDSTPRLMRFLHRLDNNSMGRMTDLVDYIMRPTILTRQGADISDEMTERIGYRELKVRSLTDVQMERLPDIPGSVMEHASSIQRRMAQLEPAMNSADLAGTNANPQTGATATVGVLAQRERDTILEYKVGALSIFDKKIGQKALWILQKTMQESVTIPSKYLSDEMLQKLSDKEKQKQSDAGAQPTGLIYKAKQWWSQLVGSQEQQPPEAISTKLGSAVSITLDWKKFRKTSKLSRRLDQRWRLTTNFIASERRTFGKSLREGRTCSTSTTPPNIWWERCAGLIKSAPC